MPTRQQIEEWVIAHLEKLARILGDAARTYIVVLVAFVILTGIGIWVGNRASSSLSEASSFITHHAWWVMGGIGSLALVALGLTWLVRQANLKPGLAIRYRRGFFRETFWGVATITLMAVLGWLAFLFFSGTVPTSSLTKFLGENREPRGETKYRVIITPEKPVEIVIPPGWKWCGWGDEEKFGSTSFKRGVDKIFVLSTRPGVERAEVEILKCAPRTACKLCAGIV